MTTGPIYHRCLSSLILTAVAILPLADVLAATGKPIALTRQERVVHVLSRLTFGPRPGDVEQVAKGGVEAFIKRQLDPDSIDDSELQKRLDRLPTLNLSTPVLAELYNQPRPLPSPTPKPAAAAVVEKTEAAAAPMVDPNPSPEQKPTPPAAAPKPMPTPLPRVPQMVLTELQRAKLLRAVYSERQLYELVVDFWENHFSIYGNKDAARWMMTAFDRDAVRPFAMGRFRELLGATAKSPAMLFYLDNWQSSVFREYPATKDRPARTSGGINENYARELLELHTMGVDSGYTQKDVQEVARCFTGWSIRKPAQEGLFVYNPGAHDNGEKTVLGVRIPAGGGIADGDRVLDILAKHPKTARHISTKLARRFISDNPPAAVVDRAAKVFLATDGSITETLRSILTSQAFFSRSAYQAKVKSPFEFVASALRITNARTDAQRPVLDWIGRMGQPVYGRVTPDGYPETSSGWLSNNDLLARLNFASAFALNGIPGTTVQLFELARTTEPGSLAGSLIVAGASQKTLDEASKLSAEFERRQDKVVRASIDFPPVRPMPAHVRQRAIDGQVAALALGSPEFQRR